MPAYQPIVGGLKALSKWALENAPKKAQDLREIFKESLAGRQLAHATDPTNIESIKRQGLTGTPYFMVGSGDDAQYAQPMGPSNAHFSMFPTKIDLANIHTDPEVLADIDPDAWNYFTKLLRTEHPGIPNEQIQYHMQGLSEYQRKMYNALDTSGYLEDPTGLAVLSTKPILPSKLKLTETAK